MPTNHFIGSYTLMIWAAMARNEANCSMRCHLLCGGVYHVRFQAAELVLWGLAESSQLDIFKEFLV